MSRIWPYNVKVAIKQVTDKTTNQLGPHIIKMILVVYNITQIAVMFGKH